MSTSWAPEREESHARRVKGGLQALCIVILFGKINCLVHQTNGCPGNIDGHVAAAHHNHTLAQFNLKSEVDVDQKVDAVVDTLKMSSRNVEFASLVEPGGKQNCIELRPQFRKGDVASQRHARMQRDSHSENVVDFHLDDFPRQAKLRNAKIEHSARDGCGFKTSTV